MYSDIKVAERTAAIHVYNGWGPSSDIKLVGSTFPIVPAGTIVDKLSVEVPDGLQGVAFFCKVEKPRRMGSGKTAYLDHTTQLSASVLLSWVEEDGKLFVKADKDMSAAELAKFNSFVRSDAAVLVVDSERKIAYISDILSRKTVDPAWTYKSVSMEAILKYITKKLTMKQLDGQATSEQRTRDDRDELLGLRGRNRRLEDDNSFLQERRATAVAAHNELVGTLMESEGLHKFLKRLPVNIRPKVFNGFVKAMDSLKEPATE